MSIATGKSFVKQHSECWEKKRPFQIDGFGPWHWLTAVDQCDKFTVMASITDAPNLLQSDSPHLNSWDFLPDLDLGLELNEALLPQAPTNTASGSSERVKEKNRRAQRRFRERAKVNAELQEAQHITI